MYSLGPFQLAHPFLLAPMAGITNSPFRRLMRRMDSALVVSELVSANGMVYGNERTAELLEYHEEERLIGLQIFGEKLEALCDAARQIEVRGPDFIDLNLGCPVPKVVKKGAGSAMCRDLIQLRSVLSALVESVKIPITIKIRTGWDSESLNALEVVKVAADSGVSWVAIHGRTRAQGYTGLANWELIGNVKAKSPIPIIGNGDVQTAEQAVQYYKEYGVDAVMIGRAALRNPFIFKQASQLLTKGSFENPDVQTFLSLLQDQKKLLQSLPTERLSVFQSRKFLAWYSAGYHGSNEFRKKLFQLQEFEEIWSEAFSFFEARLASRSMDFLQEPFLMGGHG